MESCGWKFEPPRQGQLHRDFLISLLPKYIGNKTYQGKVVADSLDYYHVAKGQYGQLKYYLLCGPSGREKGPRILCFTKKC